MRTGRVCVIGAGPSGLAAAKALSDRGLSFDCFEKGSDLGGLWRYDNDSGSSAAYRSLHINTSKTLTQFADFPMPEHYPDFPHHSLMLEYFEAYADEFELRKAIRFNASVESVRALQDGTFGVVWADRTGQSQRRVYEAVIVASGHHSHPHRPEFPGTFSGQTLHSHDYRTPAVMKNRRVLVIGMGNSGCDIACETSRVSQQTFLSARRGAHLIPKYLLGKPLDRLCHPAYWRYLPRWLFQRLFAVLLKLAHGRQERFGVPRPAHGVLSEHPTISSDLINMIGHGLVRMKPNVVALEGDQVAFQDGSRETIDVIVYATGYDIRFPFLDESLLKICDNRVGLYKMVVHPEHAGLYFVGLVQPWGSIMPLAEAQSQWIAQLIEGVVALPDAATVTADIANTHAKMQKRYTDSRRHTIQVDFYAYLDALKHESHRGRRRAAGRKPTIRKSASAA